MEIVFKKQKPMSPYEHFVRSAYHNKSNLPIPCSATKNYKTCMKYFSKLKEFEIEHIKIVLGKKYSYFAYDSIAKEGILQFNDKQRWTRLYNYSKNALEDSNGKVN